MEPTKIEIKPIDLKYQKPKEVKAYYMELYPDHFKCVIRMMAEEPCVDQDEHSGWEEQLTDSVILGRRTAVNGIDFYYVKDPGCYCVLVSVDGVGQDLKTFFAERKDAKAFCEQMWAWALKP